MKHPTGKFWLSLLVALCLGAASMPALAADDAASAKPAHHHAQKHKKHKAKHKAHRGKKHASHAVKTKGGGVVHTRNDGRGPISNNRNRICKTDACFQKHPGGHYVMKDKPAREKKPIRTETIKVPAHP